VLTPGDIAAKRAAIEVGIDGTTLLTTLAETVSAHACVVAHPGAGPNHCTDSGKAWAQNSLICAPPLTSGGGDWRTQIGGYRVQAPPGGDHRR
jgi:hypothetical protein